MNNFSNLDTAILLNLADEALQERQTNKNKVVTIEITEETIKIKTPYTRGFITDLKARIPSNLRSWNKYERVWLVNTLELSTVQQILYTHFGDFLTTDLRETRKETQRENKKIEKTHYQILSLPDSASAEEIKKAYRKIAAKTHPDRGGNKEEFIAAQRAYAILSNPSKRKRYNAALSLTA